MRSGKADSKEVKRIVCIHIYTYIHIPTYYMYILCIYIKYLSAGKADSKEVKRIADDFAMQVKILTSLLATKLNSLLNRLCIMARALIFEKSHHESNPATKWMQFYNYIKCLLATKLTTCHDKRADF